MDHGSVLKDLRPSHDYFIGIDSDGCVFDTMEVKHKEFFVPNFIRHFDLFTVSGPARETWEFVNLYSVTRGINRFPALLRVLDMLEKRKDVIEKAVSIPQLPSLKQWIGQESRLSNQVLRSYFETHRNIDLEQVLEWSEAVNDDINRWLKNMPPFRHARMVIERTRSFADTIVVSQTPYEALEREWKEHDLKKFVNAIAGQESGTKSQHIAYAAKGKYPDNKILMIGDAPGDLKAAEDNEVLFFPVIPGIEDLSWKNLLNEGLERFMSGNFTGEYQAFLITEFRKHLPEKAPWE